ncbi:ATP-binding protein [Streptomyces sp. PU10]|uniref:ATP-binding protein n=1 Tax=Streptomyces TaxID=1883 RepID=UPI0013E031F8|nr:MULTISPECIES: ATP-binding protein [unclassified Streptomyces]MBH5134131.1 ATP-binding protein [Streptomyces sp. HB-N217]MDU0256860.1 ATP-binding protein [Streptomyces sp. PU10]QKW60482.1 ATP-binding protein [Streptomyces sp. NA03103]WSU00699.1 ATP-binding protein [Streptomyces sp. NBC_01124]
MHDHSPAPASWRIALPHSAAAVPVARALVRNALAELEHTADGDTAELLTAELVANAVEHTSVGRTPIELVVELRPTACQVEVHDPDPAPPADLTRPDVEPPDPWREGGRGLLLIRALSSSCGHRPTGAGKAVWFRLPAVPAQRRPR